MGNNLEYLWNPFKGPAWVAETVWNQFSDMLNPQVPPAPSPGNVTTLGGTQVYEPTQNTSEFFPRQTAESVRSKYMADLYKQHLLGGGYEGWRSDLEARKAELERMLGGSATGGYTGSYYEPAKESYGPELEAINRLLESQGDIDFNLGALGAVGEKRAGEIDAQTGAYGASLRSGAEDYYQSALANLARRGVTGGSPEFELHERQADTLAGIDQQAIMFGEQLRSMDEQAKLQLLSAIEGGLSSGAAQAYGQQAAAQNYSLGQQQIAQQQAYNQWQQQQMQNQALQNLLNVAGRGFGGLWQGQGQGGAGLFNRYGPSPGSPPTDPYGYIQQPYYPYY